MPKWWLTALAGLSANPVHAEAPDPLGWPTDNPIELGRVQWSRGYDDALARARTVQRPVLVLFDEVPGCSTVRNYGQTTLSHPLVVDAIESLFVPVVVYNNVSGDDRRVLDAFREPSWNNPVVRIVDADGAELAPRLTGDWSVGALLERMVAGLIRAGEPVPEWLTLVTRETTSARADATYAMGCFWSGEAHLGQHPAVLSTRTGFVGGREVVHATFDPTATTREGLDRFAAAGGARAVGDRPADLRPAPHDDRYQIRRTAYASVPMTAAQATRVNADVGAGRDPSRWLSPRQRALLAEARRTGRTDDLGLGTLPVEEAFERARIARSRR